MKKRVISVSLAILMAVFVIPVSALAAGSLTNFTKKNTYQAGQFSDVSNEWFAPYVQSSFEFGLFNGTSPTTFSPARNLTLAEALKLAACLHSIYNTGAASFAQATPWYQPYVDYALKNGIIANPYPDYTVNATRADFAAIFAKALPAEALTAKNTIAENAIPDVSYGYSYGPAVYLLYRAGVLTGSDTAGTFFPSSNITRDAVAAIVARMANPELRQTLSLSTKDLTATEISAKCAPAVFYIELLSKTGTKIASGSGFFINSNGLAVTNYHVIRNMISAKVTTKDGKKYDVAGLVDYSEKNDLALIQVAGTGFPFLELGDSGTAVTGATIYTIGYPLGVDQTLTPGIISNASHTEDNVNFIMINASISPGSSGGALLDSKGKVIGVTSDSYTSGQNLNLAVPINLLSGLSQTKTPVTLAAKFTRNYGYYPTYSMIPDFASVTGCTLYDQQYNQTHQIQYYIYSVNKTDDIYSIRNDYLDQLDINGFAYLGRKTTSDGYYFYHFNDPSKTYEMAVGIYKENNVEYIMVYIMPAAKSS